MRSSRHNRTFLTQALEPRRLLAAVGDVYAAPADPRVTVDLGSGWRFLRADPAGAAGVAFDDSAWSSVTVPHTWNALDGQDGGSNYARGIGWYRKSITLPASLANKSVSLRFDGSSMATDVYIDGALIGSHGGAFAAFQFDVTTALAGAGTHVLAIKVDNSSSLNNVLGPQSIDFTLDGGIYRKLSLVGVGSSHVALDDFASPGVYFSASGVSTASAMIQVKTVVDNDLASTRSLLVRSVLADADGTIAAINESPQSVGANASVSLTQSATVSNPHLWNGRLDPYRYDLFVEVRDIGTGQLLDLVKQKVGIRSYSVNATQGFMLNGQRYDLHGVSIHQDRLNKGWALSDADIRQDIDLLVEVGATFLRTSHYQQAPLLYDLADEKGIVVWSEVPNVGSGNSGVVPATSEFLAAQQQQMRELIRQNYNHPSIVVWGTYNEISDNAGNRSVVTALNDLAHAEDPTRLTTGASWNGSVGTLEKITDVVAYNRYYGWYYGTANQLGSLLDSMHSASPTTLIGMSEYGAGAALSQHQLNPPTPTAGGLWHPEEYQNTLHEQTWPLLATRTWLWARTLWNMFDFGVDGRNEGDTPGRNDKGLVSYDRTTKKDSFYYYKANWSAEPFAYITSRRWSQRTTAVTELKVYSNLTSVSATLNGVSLGALTSSGYGVWKLPSITLATGNNTIVVTGTRNGQTFTDTVVWTYRAPVVPSSADIKVNFQPNDAGATPAGHVLDTGNVYGDRGGGRTYGWSALNSANARRRNINSDPAIDTFIHTQMGGTFTWEYALPDGIYDVYMATGDPGYSDSINQFRVEGTPAQDSDGFDNFDNYLTRVRVSDGRLTVTPTGANAKLAFVQIAIVDTVKPSVSGTTFRYETGHSVAMQFSEAIDPSTLSAGDLLARRSDGTTFTPDGVTYDAAARTATFRFDTPLPDGDFTATMVADAITDVAGLPMAGAYTSTSFFTLAGDVNRDRLANFTDLLTLAANYGQSARTFSEGDFNYDGVVNFTDLLILAAHYERGVPTAIVANSPGIVAPAFSRPPIQSDENLSDVLL
ncbi:MAG: glycoside hydrolase family 2 TIM barrel-domain containing protein [Tepidisphaeraceae bacterium]